MPGRPPQKRRRISRSAEFERAYRQGRSKSNRHLVLYAFPRSGDGSAGRSRGGSALKSPRGRTREDAPRDRTEPPATSDDPSASPGPASSGDLAGPRLGVSVSRRVGGAVERSRVKRLLREAFWAEAGRVPADTDYVIVARPECRALGEREGMEGVRASLAELIDALTPKQNGAGQEETKAARDAGAKGRGGL